MATILPITPQEMGDKKLETIPDAVIQGFNDIIIKKFNGFDSTFKQNEVIIAIQARDPNILRDVIFDNHWLDVEDIYRKIGWVVKFDKPGYNESYDAYFVFKKK